MGHSHNNYTHPVLDSNWTHLHTTPNIFTHVNPHAIRTLRNIHTHEQIEEYVVEFASQVDFRHYAEQLRLRMQPNNDHIIQQSNPDSYYDLSPYVYTVKYFVNNTLQDICATSYKGLLYARKVDLRLKQINDIPLSDQLYLTKATLQGFKVLYQKQGYFDITEQMIFISKEGQVRVWINSNLSKNEAMYIPNKLSKDAQGSQSEMIVQLLDLIQQNTDSQEEQVVHFKQYLTKKGVYNRLSFYRAMDEFEAYCLQERLLVEDSMKSIYELYHQEQVDISNVMEVSSKKHEQNVVNRQSQQKYMNKKNQTSMQLQLPLAQMNERKHLMDSRTSNQSERNSRSVLNVERRGDPIRVRSITSHSYKHQEISFKNSALQPACYQSQKTSQIPITQNTYFNYSHLQNTEVVSALPTPTFGLPPINTRYQQRPIEHSQPAVIRFNYVSHHNLACTRSYLQPATPKTSITPKLSVITLPHDLAPVESIRGASIADAKQVNQQRMQDVKIKNTSDIKYYTSDQIYTLDRQIAEDLEKYLGYNISS